jgi:signal peptidase II
MTTKIKQSVAVLLIVLANFGLDRFTKILALEHLQGQGVKEVVGQFFILRFMLNDGAFLSLGSQMPETIRFVLLAILPAIALFAGFIYLAVHPSKDRVDLIAWASILGGGISNVWDRLLNDGKVIDFMNFGIGNLRTGILNVADLSITIGVIVLILQGFFPRKKMITY